ncbi:DUF3717 domain-containing protein [Burkholderia pseudomallei]|uniref:DUF3717 domain-containing protein n=1 Tax=Burkholderia pseudomallei TaxID=28450 RepID=UPI00053659B1|nr:DUF3717 domain-containing protein [Burkholderia pseudomallei]KGV73679.1 hypothetical protein X890_2872 [Burkholderia pseudomallei MSHR4299]
MESRIWTIGDIEQAINIWRARHASTEDGVLCKQARILAVPYTHMFLAGHESIDAAALSAEELDALKNALEPPSENRSE